MPTAVERQFANFVDGFLKLDGLDGFGEQTRLVEAFLKIDPEVASLTGDAWDPKLDHKYSSTFDVIGGAFLKLDSDFNRIANFGIAIDAAISILDDSSSSTAPAAASVNSQGPQADFLKLDTSLKLAGADLGAFGDSVDKLGTATSRSDFLKLESGAGGGAAKVSTDMNGLGAEFHKLGADLVELGGGSDLSTGLLLPAVQKLGTDLNGIGDDFSELGTDFGAISSVLGGDRASGGSLGADFLKIDRDFLKLDTAFSSVGMPVADILIGLLSKFDGAVG